MTALPSIPRTVVATHPAPVLKVLARLVLLAFVAATLVMIFALVHELMFRLVGQNVPAKVVSIHERQGTDGGAYTHHVLYRYVLPGHRERTDRSRISWGENRRLTERFITVEGRPADITVPADMDLTTPVRAYAIGPLSYSRAERHEWGFAFLLIPALFAPTGALMSVALYLAVIVRPRRHKWLYTDGANVRGAITRKFTRTTRYGVTYYVQYQFVATGGQTVAASTMLPSVREFDQISEGQSCTVLYNSAHLSRSTIYEYGGYRCV